jgi:ribonuclease HI
MTILAYFDGSCEPMNPGGIATYGYVIYEGDHTIQEGYGLACDPFSNQASNNVAEYIGLIKALEFIVNRELSDNEVVIRGDSQLIIRQMTGSYSVNSERLLPFHAQARALARQIKDIKFLWIPREQNANADRLSHRAYEAYINDHPEVIEKVRAYGATERQKAIMNKLKIEYDLFISKYQASRLINQKLRGRK